jgi:hypothetical protein
MNLLDRKPSDKLSTNTTTYWKQQHQTHQVKTELPNGLIERSRNESDVYYTQLAWASNFGVTHFYMPYGCTIEHTTKLSKKHHTKHGQVASHASIDSSLLAQKSPLDAPKLKRLPQIQTHFKESSSAIAPPWTSSSIGTPKHNDDVPPNTMSPTNYNMESHPTNTAPPPNFS